ncbi:hypothetical protein NMY22_g16298 [Coprinellus aureogranulatus]|nr:hypothetical protein NMY22_g16298 [Coprinellus aureogranulatus]
MSVSFSHDIQYQISSPINSTGRVLTLASAATGLYVMLEPDTKDDAQQWVFWASETTSGYQIENYKYDTYYVSKEGTTGLLNSAKETMDWYIFPEEGTSDYRICQDAGCALAWTPYSLAGGPSSSSQVYVIAPGGGASDLWRIVPMGSTPSVTTTSTTSAQISTALPTTATFTVINNPTSTTPSIPLSTETSALSKEDQNVVQECCGEAKSKCKFKSSARPVENMRVQRQSAERRNVNMGGSFELQHSFSYQVTTNGGLGFAGSAIGGALLANVSYLTRPGEMTVDKRTLAFVASQPDVVNSVLVVYADCNSKFDALSLPRAPDCLKNSSSHSIQSTFSVKGMLAIILAALIWVKL